MLSFCLESDKEKRSAEGERALKYSQTEASLALALYYRKLTTKLAPIHSFESCSLGT